MSSARPKGVSKGYPAFDNLPGDVFKRHLAPFLTNGGLAAVAQVNHRSNENLAYDILSERVSRKGIERYIRETPKDSISCHSLFFERYFHLLGRYHHFQLKPPEELNELLLLFHDIVNNKKRDKKDDFMEELVTAVDKVNTVFNSYQYTFSCFKSKTEDLSALLLLIFGMACLLISLKFIGGEKLLVVGIPFFILGAGLTGKSVVGEYKRCRTIERETKRDFKSIPLVNMIQRYGFLNSEKRKK